MPKPIYLDYNATTPHDPEVIAAMRPFLEEAFGNPSSSHFYGNAPQKAVADARSQVAELLGSRPEEIVFTSGGTESNNHALKGVAEAYADKGNHIITSRIEHPAILEVCQYLEKNGVAVTYVSVDDRGMVSAYEVEKAVTARTVLISIMHANNEVGTIQPLADIARIAKAKDILLHTDAAQSVGKIPTRVEELGVDLLSVAGHKIYAPKGVGALFIRNGIRLPRFMQGAGQESGRRPGTENVLEIVGLGKACEIAARDLEQNMTHMQHMRDRLYEGIRKKCVRIRVNGHPQHRLPNTLSISFEGLEANRILERIASRVAASAGAACHSDRIDVSGVLKAMAVPLSWAKGTLRLTTGRMTTEADIDHAIGVISQAVESLND
ncbi:MAG: cysteine desulfurase [Deltaproteobacteria bacterium]|jgi:cysteine desulfurase|nr:cysteine desulfurase [Deltaproteobacteria bacterium]